MKKLTTLILFLLIAQISYGQIDNTTKNKIKAYYFTAENLYEKGEYSKALDKISEIEAFGVKLATSQNLKVKTLVKLKQYQKAKEELDALYSLNPNKEIYEDIAEYSSVIDDNLIAENEAREKRLADQTRLEQQKKERLASAQFGYSQYRNSKLPDNLGLLYEKSKYGIIKNNGDLLVPLNYTNLKILSPNFYAMQKGRMDFDIYTQNGIWFPNTVEVRYLLHPQPNTNQLKSIKHLIIISEWYMLHGKQELRYYLYSIKHNKFILKKEEFIYDGGDINDGVIQFDRNTKNGYSSDTYQINISQYL
tara:strand:+ start:1241 stop:2158 length:918 start_codon:yes stop_codon:yes gene_type:complete